MKLMKLGKALNLAFRKYFWN